LKSAILLLEILRGICGVGFAGFIVLGVLFDNAHELLRVGKWKRPQHDGVDHAEDGDVGADTKGQDENSNDGKAGVEAQGAECEAKVLKGISPVVSQTAATVHVLSYVLAHALDGENIAKLAFGFFAGGFGMPALGNKIVYLGFEVKTKLIFDVCHGIET
jgi:hypothetical protein